MSGAIVVSEESPEASTPHPECSCLGLERGRRFEQRQGRGCLAAQRRDASPAGAGIAPQVPQHQAARGEQWPESSERGVPGGEK
jgi:hypothetical protein